MKRTLRYISYTLMYLIISIASAYGVILFSTASPNKNSDASVPKQITNIIESISSSPTIEGNIVLSMQSDATSISVEIDLQAINNLEPANKGLTANANVLLKINEQTTNIDITYQNSTIFLSAFNNKFQISTPNLIAGVMQILPLLNLDLSSMGIDLATLDLNMILSMMSNLTETKNENQNILDIELPVVGSMQIVTDKNYFPLSLSLPSAIIKDATLSINGNFNRPENVEIPTILSEEYINLDYIFEIIDAGANLVNQEELGLAGSFAINGTSYPVSISSNKTDGSFIIKIAIGQKDARIIMKNSTLYFDYQNIYLKFELSQIDELTATLEKLLNISLSNGLIDTLLNIFANNLISLPNEIDISNFDLSVIEKFEKTEENYLLVIKDFGQICVTTNQQLLSSLNITSQNFSLALSPQKLAENIDIDDDKYAELSTLLPVLNSGLDIINAPSSFGTFGLKFGKMDVSGSYQLSTQNEHLLFISTINLLNETFNLTIKNNTIYLTNNAINLLLPLEDMPKVFEFISNYFGLDLSTNGLFTMLEELLSADKNAIPLLSLSQEEDSIIVALSTGLEIKLTTSSNGLVANMVSPDFALDFSLSASEEELSPPVFNISKFVKVADLLKTASNTIDYFGKSSITLNINLMLDDLYAYGYVVYKNGMISATFTLEYASQKFYIIFKPDNQNQYNLYIKTNTLALKLDMASLEELFAILDTTFGFDIKGLLDGLQNDFSTQLQDFDFSKIDLSIISSIEKNLITLNYKDYSLKASMLNNRLQRITVNSPMFEAIVIPQTNEKNISVNDAEYSQINNLPQNLNAMLSTMQNQNASLAYNININNGSTTLSGNLQYSLGQNPAFNASINLADLTIKAGLFDKMFYVDFDGLKAKMDFDSAVEVGDAILTLFGIDKSMKNMFEKVDFSTLLTIMMTLLNNNSELGSAEMMSIVNYIKSITSTQQTLTITIDSALVGVNGQEMIVSANFNNNQVSNISIKNFYLSSENKIDINLDFKTFTGIDKFSNLNEYMDVSALKDVFVAVANMADEKTFKVQGQADLSIIGIDKSMPFTVMISLERPFDPMVMVELSIPTMVAINNDDSEKYEFGDVNGGSNRKLTIYYKKGFIYMHRTESISKVDGSRNYERKVRLGINEFVENIVYYLADWGFGLNSYIMDAVNDAVEKSKNRPTPIDYSKVLYSVAKTGNNYGMLLNLAEIAYSDVLDKMTVVVGVKSQNNQNVLDYVSVDINLPFTSVIEMSISIDKAIITTGDYFDRDKINNYVKNYNFATSISYHLTSKGWQMM